MAKQTNKTVIGAFVILSIAIFIGSIMILGGGQFFKKKNSYVLFFENSIKGLNIGSPVIMGGVEIGSVKNISLNIYKEKLNYDVPVIIEIDPSQIEFAGESLPGKNALMKRLVEKGLRAQLALQSFVTGKMEIDLKFIPEIPVRLTGLEPKYFEIPTAPSKMEQLAQKIEKLPIERISEAILKISEKFESIVTDEKVDNILNNVNTSSEKFNVLLDEATLLIKNVRDQVQPISKSLESTLGDARTLILNSNDQVGPVSEKIQILLKSLTESTEELKIALQSVNGFIGDDSNTRHKLNRSLDEIGAAARSMESLSDYLERHPESLLRGKGGQ